jgi:hypothetical protein
MRKPYLSAVLTLAILTLSLTAWGAWKATASFTPPAEAGTIFAVINADRSAATTSLSVDWGSFHRSVIVGNPYGNCARTSNAGFILKVNHSRPDSTLFTLSTTGTIVRGPYQGFAPAEVSHSCYKIVNMRAR